MGESLLVFLCWEEAMKYVTTINQTMLAWLAPAAPPGPPRFHANCAKRRKA
jgi:hypothetical protein